jgi:two-component system response regulator FixJ
MIEPEGPPSICIVDDDAAVRDALTVVFELEGFDVDAYETGDRFLAAAPDDRACVLLDVHMPGRSGIETLQALMERGFRGPVFMISGQGDIPVAVRAIKEGALDFVEKPFDMDTVVTRVREALAARAAVAAASGEQAFHGIDRLTPREQEVLKEIIKGLSNKEAGRTLKISPRTIEVHRARIMQKLGARNAADLVRIVLSGGPEEAS